MPQMNARRALALGLMLALALAVLPAAATRPVVPDGVSAEKLALIGVTRDHRPVETFDEPFFTDVAFQGQFAYQGTWNGGFRVVDVSRPWRPRPVSEVDCGTVRGDVGVYGDLVFRSIDTPVAATTLEETCDAPPAASGFEGIQIFEVRKPWRADADDLVAAVPTDCGSRTHTVVPDPRNRRVLLYVSSGETVPEYNNDEVWRQECSPEHEKFQIVSVPLRHPEDAEVIADVPLGRGGYCDEIGVLLSMRTKLAVCAGSQAALFDISDLGEPQRLRSFSSSDVTHWRSAALSRDGSVAVLGWEPGGGVRPRCKPGDPRADRSIFFYGTESGELLGTWVLPRLQSAEENCAVHGFSVIPTGHRDLLAVSAYQAGTYVVDFSDPAEPKTVAWYDPPPLDPGALTFGGAWSSAWYNGFVYESDVTHGLNVFRLDDRRVRAKADRLRFLNPQTVIRDHGWCKRWRHWHGHRHW
jgi:hypothetical protein